MSCSETSEGEERVERERENEASREETFERSVESLVEEADGQRNGSSVSWREGRRRQK